MSTKTSIKRIALVAVSALGFGLLSVAPSSAAQDAGEVNSISLAQATVTPTVGASVAINFLAKTDDVANATTDADFIYRFTGYLSAYPAGGFAQVGCSTSAPSTDTEIYVTAGGTTPSVTEGGCTGATYSVTLDSGTNDEDYTGNSTAVATAAIGAAQFSFTPTLPGAYTLTIWNDADNGGDIDIGEAVQTINLTVIAAAGFSSGLTTSIIDIANNTGGTEDVDLIAVSKTAGEDAATIDVQIKDTAGAALGGMRVTAEVTSGPGLVDVVSDTVGYTDAVARADALTLASNVTGAQIHVTADGLAGASTITVKVQNPTTLATLATYTEKLWFYGTAAKLDVAVQNLFIARANASGEELGCDAAGCTWATVALTPAVYLTATDSGGNIVPLLNIEAVSADTSVIGSGSCTEDDATAGDGLGYYNCSVVSAAGGTSGASTTVTFRTQLATGAYVTSAPVTFKLGGALATGTLTLDKTTYSPGEAMVVTREAKDAAGNAVYDGVASPAVIFTKAIGGTAPAAGQFINGKSASSTSRPSVYAPSVGGAFEARATFVNGTTAALTQVKFAATVSDDAASAAATAASDAALEAIDAANAATDAANLAAEAADAATVAAEEARDAADAATAAVEALATEVATLIAGLKAQITTLANTVAKIAKKVKA